VASLGLIAVLIALPTFAIWTAISTYRYGADVRVATAVSDAYDQARYAVGAEESLERKYRLEPSPEVRARHREAAQSLLDALVQAEAIGGQRTSCLLGDLLPRHREYMAAIDSMFAAVDAGDLARYAEIDEHQGDPAFDQIEQRVFAAARDYSRRADDSIERLARLQMHILVATPPVFAIGLGLVVFFWSVLNDYQRQVRQSEAREANAIRQSERRFRSLIQHASDLILICAPAGAITYQSPTAESAWGYPSTGLLNRFLVDLVHHDEQLALRELWEQVIETPSSTRQIELRVRDSLKSPLRRSGADQPSECADYRWRRRNRA
jgi:PAS domain S-box-containing protein